MLQFRNISTPKKNAPSKKKQHKPKERDVRRFVRAFYSRYGNMMTKLSNE